MNNILIIGCGLIGSSVLKVINFKKYQKKFMFMRNQKKI